MNCPEIRERLHAYLDGEAPAAEQLEIEAHLLECSSCRAEFESLRRLVGAVRAAQPLYPVPVGLSEKLRTLLWRRRLVAARRWFSLSTAALVLMFSLAWWLRPTSFIVFAADAHQRYARGGLPLSIASDRPEVVSGWLRQNAPFSLSLPNYPAESKSYQLVGATMLRYSGRQVAYLAYQMRGRPISLLVTRGAFRQPAQAEIYRSGSLAFHFSSKGDLRLITWEDKGLSYAIVSDVQVSGAQSCVVCHNAPAESKKLEGLPPAL